MKKILLVLVVGFLGMIFIELYSEYLKEKESLVERERFLKMMEKAQPLIEKKKVLRFRHVPYNFPEKGKDKEYKL